MRFFLNNTGLSCKRVLAALQALSALGLVVFFLCLSANLATAQAPDTLPPADTTASKYIHIRYADELNYEATATDTVQKLIGHVELNQDTVFIFCDSAIILNSQEVTAQGNFTLQQGDSTTIFADSAEYSSETKLAELYGNVSLVKGKQKLFTDQLSYDANTKIATYLTGATLTDDTTFLRSNRGYFHAETDDIFFKDSVVVVNPDFTLRSDTLQYNARTSIVVFLAPTLVRQDTAKFYTESGFYDIENKIAEFDLNPQYLKNDEKAWADKMHYDGNKEEITLIGNAHFEDAVSMATADIIRHNKSTGETVLEGDGFFQDDKRLLQGDTISYNSKEETYSTRGRSHIVDGDQILDADQVDYLKDQEVGIARGNVIWQDTTEKMTVVCEYAEHSEKRDFLKASGGPTGRPLLIRVVDGDSLHISADTLMTFRIDSTTSPQSPASSPQSEADTVEVLQNPLVRTEVQEPATDSLPDTQPSLLLENTDTLQADSISAMPRENQVERSEIPTDEAGKPDTARLILAFHDVRIFKSDLQAVCDSMAYSTADSMFRLFQEPIIWSDTSQFTADHVRIQLANDAIDRIYMDENSFIVNSPDEVFFNQIKGRNSTAYFDSSELRRVMVVGNAESVYYALDDEQAYIGVNKTLCSEMKILFGNNEVEGIVFFTEPEATIFPMKEADHNGELRMPGFSWEMDKRPNSVEDILAPKKGGMPPALAPAEEEKGEGAPVEESDLPNPKPGEALEKNKE